MSAQPHCQAPPKPGRIASCLSALVAVYRLMLSPVLGGHCRFVPSCSVYAQEALRVHGAWAGTGLLLRRLASCHPWQAGGVDAVPLRPRSVRRVSSQREF